MKERVAVIRCESYEQGAVDSAVEDLLNSLGGLSSWVKAGDRVLLKPNLLIGREPDDGVTTHPSVVKALAKLILSIGGIPAIGDSPGGTVRRVEEVFEITGMKGISEELGIQLVNFDREGCYPKKLGGRTYYISRPPIDADVLVNLPKLKTHNLTVVTGAVKNCFGVIPGYRKSEYHKLLPRPKDFSNLLLDVYSLCKPDLTIVDGVIGMEGNGPSNGQLRQMGLLMGGEDAVAVDRVIAELIGCSPARVTTIKEAESRGVGVSSLEEIEVVGEEGVKIPDFKLPFRNPLSYAPSWLASFLGRSIWVRPFVRQERCERCGTCVEGCPPGAMTMGDTHPMIDYKSCISCGCCAELCPSGAIVLRKSPLLRLVAAE